MPGRKDRWTRGLDVSGNRKPDESSQPIQRASRTPIPRDTTENNLDAGKNIKKSRRRVLLEGIGLGVSSVAALTCGVSEYFDFNLQTGSFNRKKGTSSPKVESTPATQKSSVSNYHENIIRLGQINRFNGQEQKINAFYIEVGPVNPEEALLIGVASGTEQTFREFASEADLETLKKNNYDFFQYAATFPDEKILVYSREDGKPFSMFGLLVTNDQNPSCWTKKVKKSESEITNAINRMKIDHPELQNAPRADYTDKDIPFSDPNNPGL
jgi:hypothetical protein